MARLREFVPAVRTLGIRTFVVNICKEVSNDRLTTQAAAVAYAWLFAVFPFLLFLLTLFAYIPEKGRLNAHDYISNMAGKVLAHDAAETITSNLNQVMEHQRSGLLSLGLAVTLWVASGGMSMTMSALDAAYDGRKTYPFYIQRPLAILLTVIVTVLIIIVLLLLPVGAAVENWLAAIKYVPARVLWLLTFVRYGLAILLMLACLALLYTFGTRVRHSFSFITPGAVFTVLVWIVLGECFRVYVDKFGKYQKTYGAVGGVTILLLFFYLDALVLLIGAEVNNQVDRAVRGTPKDKPTSKNSNDETLPKNSNDEIRMTNQ